MPPGLSSPGLRSRAYTVKHLDQLTERAGLSPDERLAVRAVATVLPFRSNEYVVERLIDWDAAPYDPIYRLVFPQADMLPAEDVGRIAGLLAGEAPDREVRAAVDRFFRFLHGISGRTSDKRLQTPLLSHLWPRYVFRDRFRLGYSASYWFCI
jgi:hypothetical protein